MKQRICYLVLVVTIFVGLTAFFYRNNRAPEAASGYFVVDTMAVNLVVPWDIAFLPDSNMLFTERPGRVRLMKNGQLKLSPVLTIPDVEVRGKMGLLALCLHPDFTVNKMVYLAYNYRVNNATFLRVASYTYLNDSLINQQLIIEQIPGVFNHTGCRLKFGPDKKLYITTGDADVPRLSQDLKALNGKTLRINADGSIPKDNPFTKSDTARKEIWTYGHRNSQGIAFQPGTGFLYNSEHGPTGGDEINIVTKGNNYGWPLSHHRTNVEGTMRPAMEFTPSIGPAAAIFYSGKVFPSMKGNLLVACMRGEAILKIEFVGKKINAYNFLLKNNYGRIRALAEGPDGYIYFSTSHIDPPESNTKPGDDNYDMILRIRPATMEEIKSKKAISINRVNLQQAINLEKSIAPTITGKPAKSGNSAILLYKQLCAGCHGADMKGVDIKPGLLNRKLNYGNSFTAIKKSILDGVVTKGMPAWRGVLPDKDATEMTNYILSKRK